MDQELAKELFFRGATLLIMDMPERSEFGIDYNSYTTGPKFKGIKMIPPGIHFVYFNATGKRGGRAARIGFFHEFKEREIVIRRWDAINEDLLDDTSTDDERRQFTDNLTQLDQFLGPYPYDSYKKWYSLTSEITMADVERLHPKNGKITEQSDLIWKEADEAAGGGTSSGQRVDREHPVRQRFQDEQGLPIVRLKSGTEISFAQIPAAKNDATLAELLRSPSFDNSPSRLLAELQFAFVCFLMGHVYDGFEQWKRLIHILCSCQRSLVDREELYEKLLTVLFFQLKECPSDFFVDIVSRNNFLTITLSNLFASIESTDGVSRRLREKSIKFKTYLKKTFRWDFDAEPDDFKPVVVDLRDNSSMS